MDKLNYIKGALLGGWCGDAAGATLEFYYGDLTDEKILNAMHMCGGGCFNVGSGQVTDDSELEISLMNALIIHNEKSNEPFKMFPSGIIANNYIAWYKSAPFDIGNTTTKAFNGAKNVFDILNNVVKYNKQSESNGALMRCASLGVWCHNMSPNQIKYCAERDTSLTHDSINCKEVVGIYLIGLAYLLKNFSAKTINKTFGALQEMKNNITEQTVLLWFEEGYKLNSDTFNEYNCTINIGHIKHAFILTIYCLKNMLTFENAIYQVLKKGGDTDTNAKIVGSMLGALYGETHIPIYMKNPVLSFDCTQEPINLIGRKRPINYSVKNAYKNIKRLIKE